MNNVNHLLPRKVQREFYSKKRDIQWFKRTGYKLLKSLINKDGIFLNKTNEKKLISFFSLLSKYPNINTPIYKSFSVENSNVLKNNYKKRKIARF
ncbi:hypothetical protein PROPEN_02252 [Proteus penneri ATCC 35198]|nr:hypothetical protein PROPEN_02252 [Proteus penneri ATCC 35198]